MARTGVNLIKPVAGASVNWGNPLTKGLITCLPLWEGFGVPKNIVNPWGIPNGDPLLNQAVTWTSGKLGRCLNTAGNAGDFLQWPDPNVAVGTSDWTLFGIASVDGANATLRSLMRKQEDGGSGGDVITLSLSSANKVNCEIGTGGSTQSLDGATSVSVAAGVPRAFGASIKSAGWVRVFLDGRLDGSAAYTASTSWSVGSSFPWQTRYQHSNGFEWNGNIWMIGVWNRAFSDVEMEQLGKDPWQIFGPVSLVKRYWIPTAVTVNESFTGAASGAASFSIASVGESFAADASGTAAFTSNVTTFSDSFTAAAAGAAAFSATLPTNFSAAAAAEAAFSVAVALSITLAASGTCDFTQGMRVLLEAAGEAAFTAIGDAVDSWTAAATASLSFTHQISVPSTPSIVVIITDGGSNYDTPPAVTITGAGSGATAVAVLGAVGSPEEGQVVAVVVTNTGEDYEDPLTVSFDNTGTGGTGAAADAFTTNITSQQEARAVPFGVVRDGYAQLTIDTNFAGATAQTNNQFTLLPPPLNQPVLGTAALQADGSLLEGGPVGPEPDPKKLVHERAWNTWFQQLYNQLKNSAGAIAPGITTLELVCPSVDDTDAEWYALAPTADEATDPLTIDVELVSESRFGMQFIVEAGGMDYASAPTVTITGSGGSGFGATAEATVEAGSVIAVRALTSGYGYKTPISVSLTGGGGTGALVVGTPGRQWAEGDYVLWNDPSANDSNLRSYEIDLITTLTPIDDTHMSLTLQRRPANNLPGFAQYNSLMRPHEAGIEIYRLINKSFIIHPSSVGPQINALLWASMTVCAVTGKAPGFAAATINLAPVVEDPDPEVNPDRLLPPSPGLRTLTGAAYTNIGISGTLAVGQTAMARISVQAWESIRCVYGKVAIEPEGPTEFEGNAEACIVIYVCYISTPDENGDQQVGLIDTVVIDDGLNESYVWDNPPDGRTMPYHAFWPLGDEKKQDWPPTRLPLIPDALDPNGNLQLPLVPDPTESVVFAPDGQIDIIVFQVGTVTEGSDLVVTVQT